mmetsp:Transcript_18687/g.32920  ORF Transcript_18687/g.32920 Transcript_18687/m.32920 type:complete len:1597 (-) Transcript_18687:84-4874(-)|eukprot:CAMPEP_0178885682 /NCGR_PEP_ID=MMETSP0747-20121128/15515_1 /TAXON_ID=913974 /ORGANISM="Nitzschia punctata, Strain CCMP561" /LENGTH=1596 /DNA_ID=CAMNT_0020554435 /DNA_START=57 /DNA_END=4847 /DNA_ORIENTATION=-
MIAPKVKKDNNKQPWTLPSPSYSSWSFSCQIWAWYLALGALHELSHWFIARWWFHLSTPPFSELWFEVLLGRSCAIEVPPGVGMESVDIVRHAGWISSLLVWLVAMTTTKTKTNSSTRNALLWASTVTLVDALWTDLLQWTPFLPLYASRTEEIGTTAFFLYCGNFGILLLQSATAGVFPTSEALDVLQDMVTVTMMRGAQTSGVVVYHRRNNKKNNKDDTSSYYAVRSRVVNKKRTDLSVLLRNKLQRDLKRNKPSPSSGTILFAGHTRFATSSKATFEGTHPHRWTPPSPRRVYVTNDICPTTIQVENYITHNGDFDFYSVNGKTFDVETIQQWLSVVTEVETPASVDSCAIAGMVDVLRTQYCWGLSARYAAVLGMEGCDMNGMLQKQTSFPSYQQYWERTIGSVLEETFQEFGGGGLEIGGNPEARKELACQARKRIQQRLSSEQLQKLLKLFQQSTAAKKKHSSTTNSKNDMTLPEEKEGGANKEEKTSPSSSSSPTVYDITEELAISAASDKNDEDVEEDVESNPHDGLQAFCQATVDAFFDNDLFHTVKTFMKNAKGSFGLSVTSNLDAHRQMCLASRGQTISIAFYPEKGLICYGSEQAAVKAGMSAMFQETAISTGPSTSALDVDMAATRLDLDDLGGEIVVLDWGGEKYPTPPVSWPNRHLEEYKLMNGNVTAILHQESKSTKVNSQLYHRMTKLSDNPLIRPLQPSSEDPVLTDIQDIPRACKNIQNDWNSGKAVHSLNRLTAFNFTRSLRKRLEKHVKGTVPAMSVDILLTGCEVSLWLAEQFAADLKKCFPKLSIEAVSSNKILGLYGQEIAVPCLGFPHTPQTRNLHDSIVIIVSHSGGTFGPLACSNLLQSSTEHIFVVTSEWDTQIGKQLRMMDHMDDSCGAQLPRIFSTEVGMRPAEPCSVSVAATHQLLTNLLEYISAFVLSDPNFCRVTNGQITEQDLQILERCNQMNIDALTETVGVNTMGYELDRLTSLKRNLQSIGDLWSDHVLEGARAYAMCFIYIFVTVTTGWPLAYAIGQAIAGPQHQEWLPYVTRFIDAAIYFWLPQICITLIRLFQGRNLLHRMTGRTVVIGDIPWVSQCIDAFLSKCFAVSYSIAGLNVLSGNPSDHFVHRHTHRVVRGTLAIFGRPDGRLSALSTAEASVCLSCNQASSIQSRGGTCESITLGHNPFQLNLSHAHIVLKRHRPLFLCERLLVESDADQEKALRDAAAEGGDAAAKDGSSGNVRSGMLETLTKCVQGVVRFVSCGSLHGHHHHGSIMNRSIHTLMDCSVSLKIHNKRSAPALLGAYLNIDEQKSSGARKGNGDEKFMYDESVTVDDVVHEAIIHRKRDDWLHKVFKSLDQDHDGLLTKREFVEGTLSFIRNDSQLPEAEARAFLLERAGEFEHGEDGKLDYKDFAAILQNSGFDKRIKNPPSNRDERGLIQVEPSKERYFGETLRKYNAGKNRSQDMDFLLAKHQHLVQELYETRIASMQRFVAMCVLFHHMAKRVERFFATISFGWWAYRMDRTHSIVRIATTASPVSGSDVRQQMEHLRLLKKVLHSVHVIETAYLAYQTNKNEQEKVDQLVRQASSAPSLEGGNE